jgi:hypothetical protein
MSDRERLVIGRDIPWKELEGQSCTFHVTGMTALARLEGQKVVDAEKGMPYALLHCTLFRNEGAADVTLPVSHREDFKAVAWYFDACQVDGPDDPPEMFVEYEPGGGLFGGMKPRLGIVIRVTGAAEYYKKLLAGEVDASADVAALERGDDPTRQLTYHAAGSFEVPSG